MSEWTFAIIFYVLSGAGLFVFAGVVHSCETRQRSWPECEKACAPYRASDCSPEEAVCSSERIIPLRRKP
jgi:hypothetical protein